MHIAIPIGWLLIYLISDMTLKAFLKQPYPIPNQNWKIILLIGFALSLLMLLMQPFGLSSLKVDYKFLFLAGYGLVTALVLGFNMFFVISLFSEYRWNVMRHILWSAMIVFELGLANYAYTFAFIENLTFNINSLLSFQIYTSFISIVPITFLVLFRQNQLLRANKAGAEAITENLHQPLETPETLQKIILNSENGKTQIEVNVSELAFIESVGNYIHVYIKTGTVITEKILRSSISKAETEITNHQFLLKCHRAFIVNLNFVESVSGNAQGYRLKIKNSDKEVYVSRQYTKRLKETLG